MKRRTVVAIVTVAFITGLAFAVFRTTTDQTASAAVSQSENERAPAKIGPVPVVQQLYRNNCETAALSMVLAAAGRRVSQRTLQSAVAKSGPLDPIVQSDGAWIWGAPDRGFVGRVDGGSTAGGFGVYQGPIRRLAATYGVKLVDLSRKPVTRLYQRLERGRPVMVWVGLSEGPYRKWLTPSGKPISVNFGEHTVVLVGIRPAGIIVNDPLTGSRIVWSRPRFEKMWRLLGRRALGM